MKKRNGSILQHARDESLNFLLENELNNKNGTSPSPIKNPRKEEKISSPMQTPSTVRSNQLHIEIQENTPKSTIIYLLFISWKKSNIDILPS